MFKLLNVILFLLFGLLARDVVTCTCVYTPLGLTSLVYPGKRSWSTRLFSGTSHLVYEQVWDVWMADSFNELPIQRLRGIVHSVWTTTKKKRTGTFRIEKYVFVCVWEFYFAWLPPPFFSTCRHFIGVENQRNGGVPWFSIRVVLSRKIKFVSVNIHTIQFLFVTGLPFGYPVHFQRRVELFAFSEQVFRECSISEGKMLPGQRTGQDFEPTRFANALRSLIPVADNDGPCRSYTAPLIKSVGSGAYEPGFLSGIRHGRFSLSFISGKSTYEASAKCDDRFDMPDLGLEKYSPFDEPTECLRATFGRRSCSISMLSNLTCPPSKIPLVSREPGYGAHGAGYLARRARSEGCLWIVSPSRNSEYCEYCVCHRLIVATVTLSCETDDEEIRAEVGLMPMDCGVEVDTQQLPAVAHSPGSSLLWSDPDHSGHVYVCLVEWVVLCLLLLFSQCYSSPTLAKQPVSISHVLVKVSRLVSRRMLAYSDESETDFKGRVAGVFNIRPAEFRLVRAGRPLTMKLLTGRGF